jgi:hypothetical protein
MRYVAKPIAFAVKAPWKMLTVVPGLSAMKHPVESFFRSGDGSTIDQPTRPERRGVPDPAAAARGDHGAVRVRAGQRRRHVRPDRRRPVDHHVRRQYGDFSTSPW